MTASPPLPERIDSLWLDARIATMAGAAPYGEVHDHAVAVTDGRISWLGPLSELPEPMVSHVPSVHRLDGGWITPGLIDCHTHLVYAGSRVREFEMRRQGVSYEDIARAGGGILSTVAAVRGASEDALFHAAAQRAASLQSEGVTTVEIKSGYGLDTPSELKMLRVIRRLGESLPLTVVPTFLGAHALPPEFRARPDAYIDRIVEEMLPAVAAEKLAVAVDAFCERIAFTRGQVARLFDAAAGCGLPVKLHAEQLSDTGGAKTAAHYGALSADHLEYLDAEGVAAMAAAGTAAVLLPGAFYFLHESQKPPVDLLRAAGVPMAVATDCNPGSSPTTSPLLMMSMACHFFDLTPEEALLGFTAAAARALGLQDDVGTLAVGKRADMAVWDVDSPAELAYAFGGAGPCRMCVKDGGIVYRSAPGVSWIH